MNQLVQQAQDALRQGDLERAAHALNQLVSLSPRDHGAWYWLAVVHLRSGRPDIAIRAIGRAISLDRRNPDYHNAHGVALAEAGEYDEAIQCFRKAIRIRPVLTDGHYNLGKSLHKQGRLGEALEAYGRARKLDPQRSDVRESLGRALLQAGQVAQAHREYSEFARDLPDDPVAAGCLALTAALVEGASSAQGVYDRAIPRFPLDHRLRWGYARFLLSTGRFAEGWQESLRRPTRANRLPPLDRAAFANKMVLLEQEQGIGDVLFFCRFVRQARQAGTRLALRCDAKLVPIALRLELFDEVFSEPAHAESLGPDLVGPLDDLPAILGVHSAAKSVQLKPQRTGEWSERLARLGPAPYLAVTWRAGTDNTRIPEFARPTDFMYKEASIAELGRVLKDLPGTLLAVQRHPGPEEIAALSAAAGRTVHDFCALNEDLEGMSGLLCALDDYVGVSNTNMHLMAAVGGTARVLLPFPPDWRWMLEGDESPWFPGFRIYRQTPDKDWTRAMERLRRDLLEKWRA